MWYLIVLVVWLAGIGIAYNKFISKWDNSTFEKIWFSIVWPLLIPLYLIHWVNNKIR